MCILLRRPFWYLLILSGCLWCCTAAHKTSRPESSTTGSQTPITPSQISTNRPHILINTTDPEMSKRLETLATSLEGRRQELHIPGLALAVVKDDVLIYARGFGMADIANKIPVTPETIFGVGSTTKAFTSTLAAMMVEEGKMGWDDPVTKYLPYFELPITRSDEPSVTIRDLLAHRTGFARMGLLWKHGLSSREEVLRDALRAEPWKPFRKNFTYSNVMYTAAGLAIARVGNTDWDQLLKTRILEPLGMKDSTTSFDAAKASPHLALGYRWQEHENNYKRLAMLNAESIGPAGALNAHVIDMAQWVRFQLARGVYNGNRLLGEEMLSESYKPQIALSQELRYGLGWYLQKWRGQLLIWHVGNLNGYCATVGLFPESQLGFVLLANVSASLLQTLSLNIVGDHLLNPDSSPNANHAHTDGEDLTPYFGEYIVNTNAFMNAIFTVSAKGNTLAVDVPGQANYALKPPNEDGQWIFEATDTIAVSFEKDSFGNVILMRMHQNGLDFELPRKGVPQIPEIDERKLEKYLGTYFLEGTAVEIPAIIQNHRLALDIPNQMVYELHLPDEDGKRKLRILPKESVIFNEDAIGRVVSMTYYRDTQILFTMKRITKGSNHILKPAKIHRLRKSDQRRDLLKRMGSLCMKGTARSPQSGIEGTATLWIGDAKHFREELHFGKYGSMRTAATPDAAYTDHSFDGFEVFKGEFHQQLFKSNLAVIFGDWREFYEHTDVSRDKKLDGKKAHVVDLSGETALPTRLYIDPDTGDVLRQENKTLSGNGVVTQSKTLTFEDYRDVQGVRIPFRIISSNPDTGNIIVQYERIETGMPLDPDFFILKNSAEN